MLTGSIPPEDTGLPGAGVSAPLAPTASTEIWLLPASTASTQLPSAVVWIAPCEPTIVPVPAPPAANGEPAVGVSEPSACSSNAPIVLVPAVLSLTYTWPTTGVVAVAIVGAATKAAVTSAAKPAP